MPSPNSRALLLALTLITSAAGCTEPIQWIEPSTTTENDKPANETNEAAKPSGETAKVSEEGRWAGKPPSQPELSDDDRDLTALHLGPPVSEAEAQLIGHAIERAIATGEVGLFLHQFDWDAHAALLTSLLDDNAPEARTLRAQISQNARSLGTHLAEDVIRQVHRGGSYRYLRIVDRGGQKRPLF